MITGQQGPGIHLPPPISSTLGLYVQDISRPGFLNSGIRDQTQVFMLAASTLLAEPSPYLSLCLSTCLGRNPGPFLTPKSRWNAVVHDTCQPEGPIADLPWLDHRESEEKLHIKSYSILVKKTLPSAGDLQTCWVRVGCLRSNK